MASMMLSWLLGSGPDVTLYRRNLRVRPSSKTVPPVKKILALVSGWHKPLLAFP